MCDTEQQNRDKQSCHVVTCPRHSEPVVKSDPGPFAICSPVNRIDQPDPSHLGGFLGQNKASSQITQLLLNSVPEALHLECAGWKPSISVRGFRILTLIGNTSGDSPLWCVYFSDCPQETKGRVHVSAQGM